MVWSDMMTKRILIVSPFPPPFGGIASYSDNLYQGLLKAGLDVEKYDTIRYEKLRFHIPDKSRRSYIRIIYPQNIFFLMAIVLDWFLYSMTILRRKPSIVHVHTSSSWGWWRSIIYILIAKVFNALTILHIHNAIDRFYIQESGKLGRFLICRSLEIPDHLITLSTGLKSFVSKITSNRITSIYNGVHINTFTSEKRYKKPLKILFAGFVGTQKGVMDLLTALEKAKLSADEVKLTVMGTGEIEYMKAFSNNLGINEKVTFTGRVSEEEKLNLFKVHHILALPSYGEGQPISILEGLAAGMAIISTRVGSIPEIIREGENGFLIDPGDTDALAMSIRKLSDRAVVHQIGDANRAVARERYDFDRVVSDNIKVYETILRA